MTFPRVCCAGNAKPEQIILCHTLTRWYPCCRVGAVCAWELGWRPAVPVSRLLFVGLNRGRRVGSEAPTVLLHFVFGNARRSRAESEFAYPAPQVQLHAV